MTTATLTPTTPDGAGDALSRRAVLVGSALLATAGVGVLTRPRHFERDVGADHRLADLIPEQLGAWRAQPDSNLVVPDETNTGTGHEQTLSRVYTEPQGPPVMTLISNHVAHSQKFNLHRPEWCYTAATFRLQDFRTVNLDLGLNRPVAARMFTGVRGDRTEQVLYWMRVANAFPINLNQQGWVIFRNGLSGFNVDGCLVRLSLLGTDVRQGQVVLEQFARALVQDVNAGGRRLLVGQLTPSGPARTAARSAPPAL